MNVDGLKIHRDSSDLYIAFEHNSTQPNMKFFIDVDSNAKTGHPKEGGAEYVVENGYLFEHTIENIWGWKEVSQLGATLKAGHSDAVKIPLKLLKNSRQTFRVNVQALNKEWIPQVYLPKTLGEKYHYPQ